MRAVCVLLLVITFAGQATADKPLTEGLTQLTVSQQDNTFTWVLRNNTSPGDGRPWVILGWMLVPEGLPEPMRWTAPAGWKWEVTGYGQFQLAEESQRYIVGGPALEPGEELTFTYTVDPTELPRLGPPESWSFLVHVGSVKPTPGANGEWTPVAALGDGTWFDRPGVRSQPPTSEPAGAVAIAVGMCGCLGCITRWRRRRS